MGSSNLRQDPGTLESLLTSLGMEDAVRPLLVPPPPGGPDPNDGLAIVYDGALKSLKLGAPVATLDAGFSTTLYVDTNGNDLSAARGSLRLRYKTITAALAAAQAGDVVQIASGTYTENITLPSRNGISIIGDGIDSTILQPANLAVATITYAAAWRMQGLAIRNMTIIGGSGASARCFTIDGTPSGGQCFQAGTPLQFSDLRVALPGGSASPTYIGLGDINDVEFENVIGSDLTKQIIMTDVSVIDMDHCHGMGFTVNYEVTHADLPLEGASRAEVRGSYFGTIYVGNNAQAVFDAGCRASALTIYLLDNANSALDGKIQFHGRCTGNASLVFYATHRDQLLFDCSDCYVGGDVNVAGDTGFGTSTFRSSASLRNATVLPTSTIDAHEWADIDLTGGTYGLLSVVGGAHSGTIQRDVISGSAALNGGAVNVVFTVPRFDAYYSVYFDLGAGGAAASPVIVSAKASTGFTATPAGVGSATNLWVAIANKG